MVKSTPSIQKQVQDAIIKSGLSRYRIAQESGISESMLSRFMAGKTDMTLTTLQKLAPKIGLKIQLRQRPPKKAK